MTYTTNHQYIHMHHLAWGPSHDFTSNYEFVFAITYNIMKNEAIDKKIVLTCAQIWSEVINRKQIILLTLTHWGPDKIAAIFQMTFSSAFFLMKMYEFGLRFH